MASSPPAPYSASLPNPKKRPSIGSHSATTQPITKRPKLHPLRQTSFPASESTSFYPRSAVSESTSMISGVSSKTGKKLGRPRKDRQSIQPHNDDDVAVTDTASVVRSQRGGGRRGARSVLTDEGEDDEDELDGMLGTEMDQDRRMEDERRDAQRTDRLLSMMDEQQYERYNQWRRTKLNKNVLRRIVNQTVSQSVAANPLLAIQMYSKYFAGEIIERAREVREEWAKAYEQTKEVNLRGSREELERLRKEEGGDVRQRQRRIETLTKEVDGYMPNPHKGGLMPDHLREALRRYKGDGEGGGVGFGSQSHGLVGVKGAGVWSVGGGSGGRRLFK